MDNLVYYWEDCFWCFQDELETALDNGANDNYSTLKITDCDCEDINRAVQALINGELDN